MAVLTLSKSKFEKEVGKLNETLENQIAMFGTPMDVVENNEIYLEILPNRPDLLSYENWKAAFLTFIGKKPNKKYEIKKSNAKIIVDKSVSEIRPYCMAAIVKDVKFDDEKIKEIMQFQEKIHSTVGRNRRKVAMGYYMLNKIKFPVKYLAKEPKDIVFEPLEMPQKMNALQILSRHPTGREYGNQLQGLKKFPVYYDANNEVLSMPPIINSNNCGKITPGKFDVLVEASGTDQQTLNKVISMAVVDLINCGGKAFSVEIIYGTKKQSIDLKPNQIKFSLENTNKLLGLNLNEQEIKKFLEKMGYEYKNKTAFVPAWRTDVLHEVDIIEDIAIAYGYNNFIPEIPEISTIGQSDKKQIVKKKISEILTGLGLLETSSYHLTTKEAQIKKTELKEDFIQVINSKTEYNILRKDLSHYLLKIISENIDVEYPQEIFEIGRIFNNLSEEEHLAIAFTPNNYTKTKQTLEYLAKMLNIKLEFVVPKESPSYFIEGRSAEVKFKGKTIGFAGEIHPKILSNFKIKMPVALLEINLDEILKDF